MIEGIGGSNPSLSANIKSPLMRAFFMHDTSGLLRPDVLDVLRHVLHFELHGGRLQADMRIGALDAEVTVRLAAALERQRDHVAVREDVLADIAAGAPTNPDGTLNLVHYAA